MGDKRVVIVTGGSQGIGRATCIRFALDGAAIVAVARTVGDLEQTRALVREAGGECLTQACDLCDVEQFDEVKQAALDRFGRIDVLVNNAGVAPRAEVESLTLSTFQSMMEINVHAVFYACKSVWPVMSAQRSGVIVNIASVAAYDPFPGFATYGASKAWVVAFTKGLAEEGRARGIRVIGVAPGAVDTRMLRGPFPDFPADKSLAPDDVAEIIHAVASDAFRHAGGQTVMVKRD